MTNPLFSRCRLPNERATARIELGIGGSKPISSKKKSRFLVTQFGWQVKPPYVCDPVDHRKKKLRRMLPVPVLNTAVQFSRPVGLLTEITYVVVNTH
jgi:hypothetical protein